MKRSSFAGPSWPTGSRFDRPIRQIEMRSADSLSGNAGCSSRWCGGRLSLGNVVFGGRSGGGGIRTDWRRFFWAISWMDERGLAHSPPRPGRTPAGVVGER